MGCFPDMAIHGNPSGIVLLPVYRLHFEVLNMRMARCLTMAAAILFPQCTATAQDSADAGKPYRIVDGKVDAQTYNGLRRYHSSCNHCHGPDGLGSSFGPSLVENVPEIDAFRRIVLDGQGSGSSVMKGFAGDGNVEPYIDDIHTYLQARADGALGRGRPEKLAE
jgi:mono/diheme cytochrome c family protein